MLTTLHKTGHIGRKHLRALLNYGTTRKVVNVLRCELEKSFRVRRTKAMPYTATVDVTNVCNLKCPYCPTGAGYRGRKRGLLNLEVLRKFLDETADYLFITHLYNWGETLLHPQAPQIVAEIHGRRIATSISSNFNIADHTVLDGVCEAGLDHLIASIDGASQETYTQYRVKGDFDLAVRNLEHVIAWKRKHRSRRPWVDWQYIVFSHNEHEIEVARKMALKMGVDGFRIKTATTPANRKQFYGGQSFCGLLWHNVTLHSDGGLTPCCNLYNSEDDFGHILKTKVADMRSGTINQQARALFGSKSDFAEISSGHPCLRCPIVHRLPTLSARNRLDGDEQTMAVLK